MSICLICCYVHALALPKHYIVFGMIWYQSQPILSACQIRYPSHLWEHGRT